MDDAGTFIFAEEDADRVMPSRSAVLAAGRFDLHHGIMYQGGYRATAHTLDRPHSWPRHKVRMRLYWGVCPQCHGVMGWGWGLGGGVGPEGVDVMCRGNRVGWAEG